VVGLTYIQARVSVWERVSCPFMILKVTKHENDREGEELGPMGSWVL